MPIHLAITRRVRPGCEAEFRRALCDFLGTPFGEGVVQAHLVSPLPDSGSREFGILRTFASEADRADFYLSPVFREWEERVRPLTEGGPQRRELHGLECWFRGLGTSPPRWKMALLTFVGVYVVTLVLALVLGPRLRDWPLPLANAVFNLAVVALLTWAIMPALTGLVRPWLHPFRSTT